MNKINIFSVLLLHTLSLRTPRSFYKHLLGMPVDFLDIEATEPDYYKTLRQVLETPLDLLMMDLTFSAEVQQFGRTEVIEFILQYCIHYI